MNSLGICIGASTISVVRLQKRDGRVLTTGAESVAHGGEARKVLEQMLGACGGLGDMAIAVTGRKFRDMVCLSSISEPEAVELAAARELDLAGGYRTVISAGGETFMVYRLDKGGRITSIQTGNKCASGTGEFLLQQLRRMDLTLADLEGLDVDTRPHKVSGRCSVFCKSDCTHALNKGAPKERVVSGLARMMAGKCVELFGKIPRDKAALVGGCSKNRFMVHALAREIAGLHVPESAPWFEAMGAALWALDNETEPFPGLDKVFTERKSHFSSLAPLGDFAARVDFKEHPWGEASRGDRTVLGLDVGSTTTKGVLVRESDRAILAGVYLRTGGDPVGASRRVYSGLSEQLAAPVRIKGLGVTGSGRAIAGLHAGTDGVVNEIIAHARAAAHFDPEVDTIFEIGGQDAKYTHMSRGVPTDYAMNEACSAGTGSFLEESAKETLGVDVRDIGKLAYQGEKPPNFNDQCAAFISSDIMLATQESMELPDILAGLVYSICMNYSNRVKGNRPVGRKVFMQGGVCYNKAVPAAMAALTGKDMVVPPDPGLMGAYGVALEIMDRQQRGLMNENGFILEELAVREVAYEKPFTCKGGSRGCDMACEIARIRVGEKVFPFGGICNRWENQVRGKKVDSEGLNLAARRQERVFRGHDLPPEPGARTMAINRSFMTNTYFPLFSTFFRELGLAPVLAHAPDPQGMERTSAPFCFPGHIAHGAMRATLDLAPDYVFLPHLRCLPGDGSTPMSYTCVLVQGEAYYLKSSFDELTAMGERVFSPVLNFRDGLEQGQAQFLDIGKKLGMDKQRAARAYDAAMAAQRQCMDDLAAMGREALERLGDKTAVVLFGRSYNAFAPEAHKGIPAKFASRGILAIPCDMLPGQHERGVVDNMYWATGKTILSGARKTAAAPNLFGAYVTNFSCGPDSFLLGYFRDEMGEKPSLTLELDSHTADAGLETRIEAFLDVVAAYREPKAKTLPRAANGRQARVAPHEGRPGVLTPSGSWFPFTHERVRILIPSMGRFGTRFTASALARGGYHGVVLPPGNEKTLTLGRGNSSCKECLPLQLTMGALLNYLDERDQDELSVYLMPSAGGPCRFGQYNVFASKLLEKKGLDDVAVFAPTSLDGYGGLGEKTMSAVWRALIIGDIFEEMWAGLLAAARDREQAMAVFEAQFQRADRAMHLDLKDLASTLKECASALSSIPLSRPISEVPKLSLVGEIFVRHDPVARQGLVERLARAGFILRTATVGEWMRYTDWLISHGIEGRASATFFLKLAFKRWFERVCRSALAPSGLFHIHDLSVAPVVKLGRHFVSEYLTGEAVLTVGSAFHEIGNPSCGILSLGPFGCMPSRVAEAVLTEKFNTTELARITKGKSKLAKALGPDRKLPFLAVETDGNPFPQIIEARLEAFLLQASRLWDQIQYPR